MYSELQPQFKLTCRLTGGEPSTPGCRDVHGSPPPNQICGLTWGGHKPTACSTRTTGSCYLVGAANFWSCYRSIFSSQCRASINFIWSASRLFFCLPGCLSFRCRVGHASVYFFHTASIVRSASESQTGTVGHPRTLGHV